VAGALETNFQAILTVKADTGAVVTATHTDGTKVEALSTTGQVVLELPIEGTWKVTAVRGIAQYNTVTIEVTSHYNAELTAEVHIKYYAAATELSDSRYDLAAATVGNYALFGGGLGAINGNGGYSTVDAYDTDFTHSNPTRLSTARGAIRATANGQYALFAGGYDYYYSKGFTTVDAYDESLTRSIPEELSTTETQTRSHVGATSIGDYALFAGGGYTSAVDAYDQTLTHSTATPLINTPSNTLGASNSSYAIFWGSPQFAAYDKNLVRTTGIPGMSGVGNAVRAGNYVLFTRSSETVAIDLFLTKTLAEGAGVATSDYAAATVNDLAVIGGSRLGESDKDLIMYDPFLVKTTADIFSFAKSSPAATTLDNFVIFGGGRSLTGRSRSVTIFQYV